MSQANPALIAELVAQAKQLMDQIEAMKPLYNSLDEITLQILKANGTGPCAADLELIDAFESKNVAFTTTSVKRFKLQPIKAKKGAA